MQKIYFINFVNFVKAKFLWCVLQRAGKIYASWEDTMKSGHFRLRSKTPTNLHRDEGACVPRKICTQSLISQAAVISCAEQGLSLSGMWKCICHCGQACLRKVDVIKYPIRPVDTEVCECAKASSARCQGRIPLLHTEILDKLCDERQPLPRSTFELPHHKAFKRNGMEQQKCGVEKNDTKRCQCASVDAHDACPHIGAARLSSTFPSSSLEATVAATNPERKVSLSPNHRSLHHKRLKQFCNLWIYFLLWQEMWVYSSRHILCFTDLLVNWCNVSVMHLTGKKLNRA